MKALLIASLILGSLGAVADHHEKWESMPFAEKKQKMSQKLDKKMKMVQENKACVDAAKDDAALESCIKKMKEQKKEMKKKWDKMKSENKK